MTLIVKLAAAAGLAALAIAAAPAGEAAAQYRGGHHFDRGWNGPEGHFVVYAAACPDLREDFRDRRYSYGRHHGRGEWRDRRVLDCPLHAWDYVPSYRERRLGHTGARLHPELAFYDRRTGGYVVQTRWGDVPVEIVWDHRRGIQHHWSGWWDWSGWPR
jgi:hypothetical protein